MEASRYTGLITGILREKMAIIWHFVFDGERSFIRDCKRAESGIHPGASKQTSPCR